MTGILVILSAKMLPEQEHGAALKCVLAGDFGIDVDLHRRCSRFFIILRFLNACASRLFRERPSGNIAAEHVLQSHYADVVDV